MSDNVSISEGDGDKVVASTDIGGVQFQNVIITDDAGDPIDWTDEVGTMAASTALTDGSTTITAGGTAQDAFAAAAVVHGYEIVNPDPSEDLWISDTTTAVANGTGCIRVAANGGSYSSPPGMAPSAAVSVVAATTGHKFTARRW